MRKNQRLCRFLIFYPRVSRRSRKGARTPQDKRVNAWMMELAWCFGSFQLFCSAFLAFVFFQLFQLFSAFFQLFFSFIFSFFLPLLSSTDLPPPARSLQDLFQSISPLPFLHISLGFHFPFFFLFFFSFLFLFFLFFRCFFNDKRCFVPQTQTSQLTNNKRGRPDASMMLFFILTWLVLGVIK